MGRAHHFKNQATKALATGQITIEQLWMGVLTDSHQLTLDDDHIIVATKGATAHATGEELLNLAARFQDGDYGNIPGEHDRGEYQWNSFHEFGTVLGIYQAADGTDIHVLQHHRLSPPTAMLPEER